MELILNRIQTPDGTILTSHHRNDYVSHIDKNSKYYAVDGGLDYIKRVGAKDYEELSVATDAPFELIRHVFHRGGRGKDGMQPLTYVEMSRMSDNWLLACIKYNEERGAAKSLASKLYKKEIAYRKKHKIKINEI